jgi:elongation factor 2
MNKVDRCILEMQMEPEDMYTRFRKSMEDVNVIIATYNDVKMGDASVAPEKGTVAFGSGLHGWGFNIERFAKIYASKMGVDKEKMMKRLWGDSYFNAKKKTWTNVCQPEGCDKPLERAFCQFIMGPIAQLMRAIMNDDKAKYEKMMGTLGIVLKGDDKNLLGKPLMKRTMQIWINAADTLLSMIVTKLPSPRAAQKYRVENLYEGPMDDAAANAIRACDPKGEMMMYVSKMVPTSDKGRFHAFGRVFSGTVATGQKVRIQGPYYKPGGKEDLNVKNIQRTVLMMAGLLSRFLMCHVGTQ